jgi:hypothetical protein
MKNPDPIHAAKDVAGFQYILPRIRERLLSFSRWAAPPLGTAQINLDATGQALDR